MEDQLNKIKLIGGLLSGLAALLVLVIFLLAPGQSSEAGEAISDGPTLVVFETQSCGVCKSFRRSGEVAYSRSAMGARAPLQFVGLDKREPHPFKLARGVGSVPTFVLVDIYGREVGRSVGYAGQDHLADWVRQNLARIGG